MCRKTICTRLINTIRMSCYSDGDTEGYEKIILLRRYPEDSHNMTGIGVYSDLVESVLKENSIPYENVYFQMNMKNGVYDFIIRGFIKPFIQILKNRDRAIYHATDELCAYCMPFIRCKRITTIHHVIGKNMTSRTFLIYWKLVTTIACHSSDLILAVSPQTQKEVNREFSVPIEKILAFYSAIRPIYHCTGIMRRKVIGGIGELTPRKNFKSLIRAFRLFTEYPNTCEYTLEICGTGAEYNQLIELTDELELNGRVKFISNLATEEVVEFYNRITLLANPSLHEGIGLSTLEAQKCNTPVIFFKHSKIPPEVTQCAVGAENLEDFALQMYKLTSDDELRKKIATKGRIYADSFGQSFQKDIVHAYFGDGL